MNNFIVRTITGVLFVTAVVCSFLSPTAMVALFTLITALTVREFCTLINENVGKVRVNAFISTIAGAYFFLAMAGYCSGFTNSAAVFVPYLITIIYLLVAELFLKAEDPIGNWAYTMLSQMYVALPFSMINVLAFTNNSTAAMAANYSQMAVFCAAPLCVFVFLWVNDTGAYITGTLIGKHKLFPRVSPGKSWEGSIGGGVLVLVVAALLWYLSNSTDIFSGFGLNVPQFTLAEWLGMGLVVVVFGTLGDLVESLLKRTIGVKDSGNILPGHGGMLDRFDSSMLAMPAVVIYLFTLQLIK